MWSWLNIVLSLRWLVSWCGSERWLAHVLMVGVDLIGLRFIFVCLKWIGWRIVSLSHQERRRLGRAARRLISSVFIQGRRGRLSVESVFARSYWMTRCLRAEPEMIRLHSCSKMSAEMPPRRRILQDRTLLKFLELQAGTRRTGSMKETHIISVKVMHEKMLENICSLRFCYFFDNLSSIMHINIHMHIINEFMFF